MKSTISSSPNCPSCFKAIGPPSNSPIAEMATITIAKTSAVVAASDLDSPLLRSFKLVPQRLQKLSPCAIGLPHPEQYIGGSFPAPGVELGSQGGDAFVFRLNPVRIQTETSFPSATLQNKRSGAG